MPLGSVCACRVQGEHRNNCHAEIDNGKFHGVLPAMVSVTQGFACADLGRLNFGNARPPTAQTLPLIGGDYGRSRWQL